MSQWKNWRERRKLGPVIVEHQKDTPKWKMAGSILFERFMKYPTRRLFYIAGFGLLGLALLYQWGLKRTQTQLRSSPYVEMSFQKVRDQKKLIDMIGEPVKFGWIFPTFKGAIQDDKVDLIVPIEGARVNGVMNIEAHREENSWILDDVTFQFTDEAGGVVQIVKSNS